MIISILLGLVMFGMGLATRLEDFKVVFSRPRDIAIGCVAQFTIMPLLAWLLARMFALDEALAIGVILVGCCPGGTASNVITYLAKGDLALSVGMTGVSTLLAPLLTPALTWLLAGKTVDVDTLGMFVNILWVVVLPIALGFAVKRLFPRATEKVVRFMPTVSSIAIAVIIALVSHRFVFDDFENFAVLSRSLLEEEDACALVGKMQPDGYHQKQRR